jgi:hypothetical protein
MQQSPKRRDGILSVLGKGFSGYEWYDEGNHHGAKGCPGVMEAVEQTFRRFQLVAPLILQAHPTALATCDQEKVWLRTLVCGPDLLVAVTGDERLSARLITRYRTLRTGRR